MAEVVLRYDGGSANYGVRILQFRGDKVARETIYVGEGCKPQQWRAAYTSTTRPPAGVSDTA